MQHDKILSGLIMGEKKISFIQVCKIYHISEKWLSELLEYGLIESSEKKLSDLTFDEHLLAKVQKAHRFYEDLDVNIPGVLVILDLLEELDKTKKELDILQRHVKS